MPALHLPAPGICLLEKLASVMERLARLEKSNSELQQKNQELQLKLNELEAQVSSLQREKGGEKQRVFTGIVTSLHDYFGVVDDEVFFQLRPGNKLWRNLSNHQETKTQSHLHQLLWIFYCFIRLSWEGLDMDTMVVGYGRASQGIC
ncbi:putative DBIRD complex subunit KIAA1967-like protein [Naja naja]|nr:putative DBIRD complex subunit KIAA1967-like protein [Naja naja]